MFTPFAKLTSEYCYAPFKNTWIFHFVINKGKNINQANTLLYCVQRTMRRYIYQGLDKEIIPWDVSHVVVDEGVTVIKECAFETSTGSHIVSVIMGDNVKRIEESAFCCCYALRFIRLSKTLEYIGECSFSFCESLEALFLPSAVTYIDIKAFNGCHSLILLTLPNDIDLDNNGIVYDTGIAQIAEFADVTYEMIANDEDNLTDESNVRVNEWLIHYLDESPFHKLCCTSFVTTHQINNFLNEHENNSALQIDAIYGMTPLHMLSINPYGPADSIAALLASNMEAVFCSDNEDNTPLEYARDYNVGGLVAMIEVLCNHRNSSVFVGTET